MERLTSGEPDGAAVWEHVGTAPFEDPFGPEPTIPRLGTGAGPQIVVTRRGPGRPETILHILDFEEAATAWRAGRLAMEPGGYCVWINDGDLWRTSGLLDDLDKAWAIRDRVMPAKGSP